MQNFFAACPKGMESLLCAELNALGALNVKETLAGVSFAGTMENAMRICLWSRYASRILMQLVKFKCSDDLELYMGCYGVAWEDLFAVEKTIAVEFSGSSSQISNTQYGAQKVKDAVCDHFVKLCGSRPNVDRKDPEILIYAHLRHGECSVGLDLSGHALFWREFERSTGSAPLKENLAAAMLARASYKGGNFFDPMCGSGTLMLEAALMATDTAPGLKRQHYGFFNFKTFDKEVWDKLIAKAKERSAAGIEKALEQGVMIMGSDADARMIERAKENAEHAGFGELLQFKHCALADLKDNPFKDSALPLTIVTNPPYGERMGNFNELILLYSDLGAKLKALFGGARLAVISSSEDLLSCLRLKGEKSYTLYNGALECQLRVFTLEAGADPAALLTADGHALPPAPDFVNRLTKNLKNLKKWAEAEDLNAYRIYDADIPEYNAAVDLYGDYVVLQEYQAPASVARGLARRRLLDMIAALQLALNIKGRQLIVKSRQRQKGTAQYEKNEESEHRTVEVRENGLTFKAALDDYLDSGIFFDSRPIRALIKEKAQGRDFLNLFAYTCTASAAAAAGGASSTLSVDMSRTYLEWGIENFTLNHLKVNERNEFLQADCLAFLSQDQDRRFDLIYIDPPTFSNSKRMSRSFEVERDQTALLANLTRHLKAEGEVIFCCNKRGFKLDAEALKPYGFVSCEDVSQKTIPLDCSHDSKIHSCFILTYKEAGKTCEPEAMVEVQGMPRWSKILKGPRGVFAGRVEEGRRAERQLGRREPFSRSSANAFGGRFERGERFKRSDRAADAPRANEHVWGAAPSAAYRSEAGSEGEERAESRFERSDRSERPRGGREMSRGKRPASWGDDRRSSGRFGERSERGGLRSERGERGDRGFRGGRDGGRRFERGPKPEPRKARVWGPEGLKSEEE